jgi:hypothetical protein
MPTPNWLNSMVPYRRMTFDWPDGHLPARLVIPTSIIESYPGFERIIAQVFNYRVCDSECPFQVIQLQCGVEKYLNSFDLNICANYMSTRRLVIKNPLGLLKQTVTYGARVGTSAAREQKTRERIEKYRKRGFKV